MSGIYIPGMEMPTKCDDCEVLSDDLVCPFTGLRGYNGKPEICPLVEVPDHGRLIDADALDTSILQAVFSYAFTRRKLRYTPGDVRQKIANAPTIIPADEANTTQSNTSNALDALDKEADTT